MPPYQKSKRTSPIAVASRAQPKKNQAGLSSKELEHYRELLLAKRRELVGDMSSMEREALRSATLSSAQSLGIERDRGTLAAGKRADFLVLSEDPLRDVRSVRKISEIYKNGAKVGPIVADAAPAR